jgi:adenosylcobinamide-phosphate synthase
MEQITSFLASIASLHEQILDPARFPVAAVAIVFVAFMGVVGLPLGGNANPYFWRVIDLLFGPLGGKLDKQERSQSDLVTRGTILTITALIVSFLIGSGIQILADHYPSYLVIDILALSLVLTVGTVWQALLRLQKAQGAKTPVKGAFYTIAKTTRTNLAANDEYTITRVGMGMGAKSFDKGVVAPIIWYLIGGLPVAFLYAGLAGFAWRFGKEGYNRGFGNPALALEKLMGFVPNVLSGLYIALAGLITPTAGMTRAVFSLVPFRKGSSEYSEGGAALTALAYALNVSLGGPTQDLDGSAIKRGWVGPEKATAKLSAGHLHRGLYIIVIAHLLFLVSLLCAIVFEGNGFFAGNG